MSKSTGLWLPIFLFALFSPSPTVYAQESSHDEDEASCCEIKKIEINVDGQTERSEVPKKVLKKLIKRIAKAAGAEEIGNTGAAIIEAYEVIVRLTHPWDIYVTVQKGICKDSKCVEKEKIVCRAIPRDKHGKAAGMAGGAGQSKNEAWPPRIESQREWWEKVGNDALARALANILKYCECDDGREIWPPPDIEPVPQCKAKK